MKVKTKLPRKRLTKNAQKNGWRFVNGRLRYSTEKNPPTGGQEK